VTTSDAAPVGADAVAARRRARRVAVQVFAVEIVTVTALWLLGVVFGPR
jgi:hypothetical protein